MPKEVKCKKTKNELYWRERCIDIIMLNIPIEYHEKAYLYYIKNIVFRTEKLEKVYDRLIKELAEIFGIKVIIE